MAPLGNVSEESIGESSPPSPRVHPAICGSYFDPKQSRKADLINCFKISTLWDGSNARKCAPGHSSGTGLRGPSSKPSGGPRGSGSEPSGGSRAKGVQLQAQRWGKEIQLQAQQWAKGVRLRAQWWAKG